MSAVGKILVFLNLVFAFVVATFAILDYTARTNWADKYKALEKSYEVVSADRQTWENKARKMTQDQEQYDQEMAKAAGAQFGIAPAKNDETAAQQAIGVLTNQKQDLDKTTTSLKKAKEELGDRETTLAKYKADLTVAQKTVEIRQADNEALRKTLDLETQKNTTLTLGIN